MAHIDHSQTRFAPNVRDLGAVGDGQANDTAALQAALDACARAGGGTLVVPAGRYVTGALFFQSNLTLHLEAGATLLGSEDPADYPVISSRWEGSEQPTYAPLLSGKGLVNVAVTGRGRIDGRGAVWWRRFHEKTLAHPRPRLLSFVDCENVLIEGITLANSPSWTINPVRCRNLTIHNVTVMNPGDSPNTDGINPDSCRDVRISDCSISVGDDCITLKSGNEAEDPALRTPCEHITIVNCTMANGHGGVVIGSEMSGDVRNVVIANCVFVGTERGIRLKSRRGRGGVVEDVRVSNIVMTDVLCPLTMNLYYGCGAWGDTTVADKGARPVNEATPRFRRISVSQITARNTRLAAAFLYGLAEMPLEDVTLSDISVGMAPEAEPGFAEMADGIPAMARAGIFARNIRGLRLHNVAVSGQVVPALDLADAAEVELSAVGTPTPTTDTPALRLRDVRDAFVHSCRARAGTGVFLQAEGAASAGIVVTGNDLSRAIQPVQAAAELQPGAICVDGVPVGPR